MLNLYQMNHINIQNGPRDVPNNRQKTVIALKEYGLSDDVIDFILSGKTATEMKRILWEQVGPPSAAQSKMFLCYEQICERIRNQYTVQFKYAVSSLYYDTKG